MNKKHALILLVLFSMGFSRASYAHKVTVAPDLIFSTAFNRGEAEISKGAIKARKVSKEVLLRVRKNTGY